LEQVSKIHFKCFDEDAPFVLPLWHLAQAQQPGVSLELCHASFQFNCDRTLWPVQPAEWLTKHLRNGEERQITS
jgi:hypothetical protein